MNQNLSRIAKNISDLDQIVGLSIKLEESLANKLAKDLVKSGMSVEEAAEISFKIKEDIYNKYQKKIIEETELFENAAMAKTALGAGGLALLGGGLYSILTGDHHEADPADAPAKTNDVQIKKPDINATKPQSINTEQKLAVEKFLHSYDPKNLINRNPI